MHYYLPGSSNHRLLSHACGMGVARRRVAAKNDIGQCGLHAATTQQHTAQVAAADKGLTGPSSDTAIQ
jgi:hypothetical protein